MIDEEKAEEILNRYLKSSKTYFSDSIDEEMALDLIKIGLAQGRKESQEEIKLIESVSDCNADENEIMKTILLDVFKKHGDLCSLCEAKGQKLPECKCMKDNECLEHIIDLYGGK